MKEKIAIALVVLSLGVMLSACDMGTNDTESVNSTSSVSSGNIPSGNTDGNYDDDSSKNNASNSSNLGDKVSSFVSSEKEMIDSMVD